VKIICHPSRNKRRI